MAELAVQCAGFKLGECACDKACTLRVNVDWEGLRDEHLDRIGEEIVDLLEEMGWEGELELAPLEAARPRARPPTE